MRLSCTECGHSFNGAIAKIGKSVKRGKTASKWLSCCCKCGSFFPVEIPAGKIAMAFALNDPEYHTADFIPGNPLVSYYAYDTPEAFLDAWRKKVRRPDSQWYWVLNGNTCICSGACDPEDINIFLDHFLREIA